MIHGERVELRPIAIGTSVMVAISALTIGLVGLVDAVPVILVAGAVGGAVTGWVGTDIVEARHALQQGGFLGLYASGLGGLAVFIVYLLVDVAAMARDGGILLLFVASPLAFVVFALEGLFGGYLGSGLRIVYLRSMSSG